MTSVDAEGCRLHRMLEQSPVLLRLKEFEALEKVTERVGSLTVLDGLVKIRRDPEARGHPAGRRAWAGRGKRTALRCARIPRSVTSACVGGSSSR